MKNPPANAGDARDVGSIPGSGRSSGRGNGSWLQYSCLEHPTLRGAWWATVHGVTKGQTTECARAHTHINQFNQCFSSRMSSLKFLRKLEYENNDPGIICYNRKA